MSKRNLGERIKLSSYDEMFGTPAFEPEEQKQSGQIVELPFRRLTTPYILMQFPLEDIWISLLFRQKKYVKIEPA